MKTLKKKADALLVSAATVLVIGCMCIVGGLYVRPKHADIIETYRSGNWSIQALQSAANIQTANDLGTDRERFLYNVACRTIGDCIGLVEMDMDAANLIILIGLGLAVIGGMSVWEAVGLRKQIAEQPGA